MEKFIHLRSPKFPILPGEKEELVNEGMPEDKESEN